MTATDFTKENKTPKSAPKPPLRARGQRNYHIILYYEYEV